jgi:TonB-linked SusC/RagA family outer membrane protein
MQIFSNLRRIALFMLSMALSVGFVLAQERTITGTVSTESEGPVPGVNVLIQGTMTGAITDMDGKYTITVPGPNTVLVFSYVGYVTEAITVGTQSVIDVVLVPDIVALQEVVVTGYTTQRKRDITGAIGVVQADKLTAIPAGNVSNQLQGRSSGVTVTGSGQPGTTSKVRIRGFGSFQNNDPLYIVDGVPTQDISSLNPNDVESLTVLKDAGAASVYGSRASNGVIVVTTKKGSKGIKVTYDMYIGTQRPGEGPTPDLCNTQDYADLQWLVYHNDGTVEVHPIYGSSTNPNPTLPSWAANTDWYDAYTDPAMIQNHDLTLSGGTDKARYFAGLGYFKQEGIVIHTYAERYSGRFNSEWTFLNDRLKVGENLTIAFRSNVGVSNLGEGSPIQMGSYRAQPIVPVKWTGPDFVGLSHTFTAGDWGGTGIAPRLGNNSNVVADLTRDKDDKYHNIRLLGSGYIDITILKGLTFRSTLGGTWYDSHEMDYSFATYENSENALTPNLRERAEWDSDWVWTNTLNLNRSFGQHSINAVAGYEAIKYGIGRRLEAQRAGYFSNDVDFRTLTNGQTITAATSDYWTPTTLVSMFAKADYSFMDKYLLSATIRRDGSSRFGPDTRYGVFPSFSAAWRIGNEAFLDGLPWITELKIRGSYGTMGNQLAVDPRNQFYLYGGDAGTSFYDLNGTGTSSLQGFRPTRIGNPDAKWETNITTNIGFEAELWNSKFGIVFDWYSKNTEDLLYNPELPGTAGAAEQPFINIASMKNHGIDMEVSYKNNWGDLGFNGSIVFTSYNNEITKIAEGFDFFDYGDSRIGAFSRNEVGHAMSAFYGYQVQGLFQSDAEINGAAVQDGAEPGFFRFANIDDSNNEIDPEDRTFIGNPNPKFTYGLNLGVTWKNFDLSTFIYGSYGNDIFNWNLWWIDFWPSFQGQKSKALLNDSWTTERTGASVPKASNTSNFSTNTQSCSYYIEDGSFLRMKNLELGYTIPESTMSKLHLKSLRLYVQGVNLFTLTKYSGLDPELGSQYDESNDRIFGVDYGNYPSVRQFIFGLNLVL